MQIDQPSVLRFRQELQARGLRVTRARKEVFEILYAATKPLSIAEIVEHVESAHFVSVYRAIDVLSKIGIAKQVPFGLKHRFELGDSFKMHHHHALCETCGASIEVHSRRIESLLKELTIESGLTPTKHYFELFGICKNCSSQATPIISA